MWTISKYIGMNEKEKISTKGGILKDHRCEGTNTLKSVYDEVAFNDKSAITKENLCTKYFPFTYKYITLNKKLPIIKENLCFFFVIDGVECTAAKS